MQHQTLAVGPTVAGACPDPLLADLNPPQIEAVQHPGGPLLVLAGAGSGKTRIITRRIAYLIGRKGVQPRHILAVTFTNKAAKEMRSRVELLLGGVLGGMTLGTFHSVCLAMLRRWAPAVRLRERFSIYDESEQRNLVKAAIEQLDLATESPNPKALLARIGEAKNALLPPAHFAQFDDDPVQVAFAKVYAQYQTLLHQNNAVDFDDLLGLTVELLDGNATARTEYQRRWAHVLVDEYQDTNVPQSRIIDHLCATHRNLTVVGDEDQAIYGFRGSDLRNILGFKTSYPEATIIKLEQNYRSSRNILAGAGGVIAHNRDRIGKTLWTERPAGAPICLHVAETEKDESEFVARWITQLQDAGEALRDVAVLYRTSAQSRVLEESLRQARLPYQIVGGLRFWDRKEVKDVMAYLRLLANPDDDQAFKRSVTIPARGVGKTSLVRLEALGARGQRSLWAVCRDSAGRGILPRAPQRGIEQFLRLIEETRRKATSLPLPELLLEVLDRSGYLAELRTEQTEEAESRIENVHQLVVSSAEFQEEHGDHSLGAFLDSVALMTDLDTMGAGAGAVTLMTLHKSKGLEFPVVFLTGLEDGVLPHRRSRAEPKLVEEERRLFYVGMTRAMHRLFLTLARTRKSYARSDEERTQERGGPSRYLDELPEEVLTYE